MQAGPVIYGFGFLENEREVIKLALQCQHWPVKGREACRALRQIHILNDPPCAQICTPLSPWRLCVTLSQLPPGDFFKHQEPRVPIPYPPAQPPSEQEREPQYPPHQHESQVSPFLCVPQLYSLCVFVISYEIGPPSAPQCSRSRPSVSSRRTPLLASCPLCPCRVSIRQTQCVYKSLGWIRVVASCSFATLWKSNPHKNTAFLKSPACSGHAASLASPGPLFSWPVWLWTPGHLELLQQP